MPGNDQRRCFRLGAFLEGTFETEDGVHGLIMLTNFSRHGVKASLNRKVDINQVIKFEIWIPGSIVPVFSKGKIMWLEKSSKEWTYNFDAGIKVLEIIQADKERIIDYAYEHWRKAKGKS